MESNTMVFPNDASNNFIYLNSLGVLFEDALVLHKGTSNINVKLSDIRKMVISRKRDISWNLVLFFFLLIEIVAFFFFKSILSFNDKLFVAGVGVLLAIAFFLIKKMKYKLIVFINHDFIEIDVDTIHKEEAKVLTSKTNRKVKEIKGKSKSN